MKRPSLLVLSLIGSTLAVAGCADPRPLASGNPPDTLGLMAMAVAGEPAQARGQKVEKPADKTAPNPLDLEKDLPPGVQAEHIVRIRATVNSEPIMDDELRTACYQLLLSANTEAERMQIVKDKLNEMIDREVVLQDAFSKLGGKQAKGGGGKFLDQLKDAASKAFEKEWLRKMMIGNHINNEEEFKKYLRANNMPLEVIRRRWERDFIAMEYLRYNVEKSITKIGHLQMVEYYDKHPDEFKVDDAVQWQDLFISETKHPNREAAKQFAEALANRIRKGEDFAKLAQTHDNGDGKFRPNSAGIGAKRGEIKPPEAEGPLFEMKDGEVRLVEFESGFHVVRLVSRQQSGTKPFNEEVQKQIREKLRREVFTRESKRFVNDLKRKAVIEIAR
jgi:parvulin-like peptidyl-prolyl isomerase